VSSGQSTAIAFLFLGLILFVSFFVPWWSAYELGTDEGINLQKAVLLNEGARLYEDIWSDQPPFLHWVLAAVQWAFPFSIAAARATILLFSCILAVSLFQTVNRLEGPLAAWASILLLATSQLFLELSAAVMIGLPAVALAMLSLNLATAGAGRTMPLFAAAAGATFAAAVLTKMFVLVALPALLIAIFFSSKNDWSAEWRTGAKATFWFALGLLAILGITLAFSAGVSSDQLISPHMEARAQSYGIEKSGPVHVYSTLEKFAPLPLYGALILGIPAIVKYRSGALLIPVAWVLVGFFTLANHAPVWFHQTLVLLPPLCWIAGVGIRGLIKREEAPQFVEWMMHHGPKYIRITVWVLATIVIIRGVERTFDGLVEVKQDLKQSPTLAEHSAKLRLQMFDEGASVVVTDKAIDAYHVGKSVPDSLAVWSAKRVATGNITNQDVLDEIDKLPRSQVLIRRFTYVPGLLEDVAGIRKENIDLVANRYSHSDFFHSANIPAASGIEKELHDALRGVTASSLGGVDVNNNGERLDRTQSKKPLDDLAVVTRPPGSAQEVGACLLAASEITQSKLLLLEAISVGQALACVQLDDGGWGNFSATSRSCSKWAYKAKRSTLDDGTLPSILYFAFDLENRMREASLDAQPWLEQMTEKALDFALDSQMRNGAWPQAVGGKGYSKLATINDDVTTGMIRMLLSVYSRNGDPALLEAARQGGEFLLSVQGKGNQAAFAQQYGTDDLPAPARKFEPVAYASLETALAINALVDLYLTTGDNRFSDAAKDAAQWLLSSQIEPGKWYRFYALNTNAPIFVTRDGKVTDTLNDLPEDERLTYRWVGGRDVFPDIGFALDRVEMLEQGEEAIREFDIQLEKGAWLAKSPTARLSLNPDLQLIEPSEIMGSTRRFVEYCAGIVARAEN